jgi:serine/threonine protein kinase
MRFICNRCRTILELDDAQPGEIVQCGTCQSPVAVPDSPTSPGAILGDFVIKRELGTGGVGTVYLAHQVTLDREVALKVLLPSFAENNTFIQEFINEARAAASVNHPNIVQAVAVNCDEGLWYFAMEYISGNTLKQILAQSGRMVPKRVLDIATEIVSALKFAWEEKQLVHRDIKPDNIMLTVDGRSKLADLGLARKITEQNEDGTSELYGTPQYIAPELLLGDPATASSDIYSLGATLYQALSGQIPYAAEHPEDIAGMHLTTPLQPLSSVVDDIPRELDVFISIMLAKRPEHRYQDYETLANDLELVKQGKMPTTTLDPDAQLPIDLDAPHEAQHEKATETDSAHEAPSGGRKLKLKSKKSTLTLSSAAAPTASQPLSAKTEDTEPEEEEQEEEEGSSEVPEKKGGKAMPIILVVLLLVLAGGGAGWYFMLGPGKVQASGEESAEAEEDKSDSKLATLQKLIQSNSDDKAIFDEVQKLSASLTAQDPEYQDFVALTGPLFERAIKLARAPKLNESNTAWQEAIEAVKAEKLRQEEEAELKRQQEIAEKERKEREEREAKEKAEREAQEKAKQEAIAEDKVNRINKAVEKIAERDFSGAKLPFFVRFAHETDELKDWRTQWDKCLEDAETFWNMLRKSADVIEGMNIKDYSLKNLRFRPAQNLIEHEWTITELANNVITATRHYTYTKDGKDLTADATITRKLEALRPEQLETLAAKIGEQAGKSEDETKQLLGAYLFVCGVDSKRTYLEYNLSTLYPALVDTTDSLSPENYINEQLNIIKTLSENYKIEKDEFKKGLTFIQAFGIGTYLYKSFPAHKSIYEAPINEYIYGRKAAPAE